MTSFGDIWKTLSALDVSKHVEKKGNLSYLSWAWAWGTLMEHYPQAETHFDIVSQSESDGSVTVWCSVTIGECDRRMWLPVMDHRNKAIPNPSARDISDARMRCMVKCLALYGLGFSLYAGEDLPQPAKAKAQRNQPPPSGMSAEAKRTVAKEAKERSKALAETGVDVTWNEIITAVAEGLGLESPQALNEGHFPATVAAVKEWSP